MKNTNLNKLIKFALNLAEQLDLKLSITFEKPNIHLSFYKNELVTELSFSLVEIDGTENLRLYNSEINKHVLSLLEKAENY